MTFTLEVIAVRAFRSLAMAAWAAAVLAAAPAPAQAPHSQQHSFGDAAQWAQVFDD
jgi:hypothetical protein